jgi:tetratricopeptide (TPR) repeat protein
VLSVILAVLIVATVVGLTLYMLAQKPVTSVQRLIHERRYEAALAEVDRLIQKRPQDGSAQLHRAEAAKLLGRFEEAIASYRELLRIDPADAAPREGIALCLTYLGREPEQARRLMEEAIQSFPQIQEFQALALAFILLRQGKREESLRLFEDNLVLLETRFRDDYTDPDPLLAETLFHFAEMSRASGDTGRAAELYRKVRDWAPGSVFAQWATEASLR